MSTPHKDNPVLGVFFALIAALMLASMNMFGKLMGEFHSPIEITFYRNLVAFIILLIGLFAFRKINLIKTKRPKAQLVRSAIGTISMVFSMWVVVIMPLTTATAFLFTSPLFVTLLSYPLLKEKIGIIKFLATLLGFSGILLIAQPDTGISIFEIFIGLLAGLLNGLVAISLRWLGNTENTLTTNFYFLLLG